MIERTGLRLLIFFSIAVLGFQASALSQQTEIPGFEQILERGMIASIDTPEFVSASAAKIADDAWVMGVVIDGEARAYSLNLLNNHEIVNDKVADRAIAAVW